MELKKMRGRRRRLAAREARWLAHAAPLAHSARTATATSAMAAVTRRLSCVTSCAKTRPSRRQITSAVCALDVGEGHVLVAEPRRRVLVGYRLDPAAASSQAA